MSVNQDYWTHRQTRYGKSYWDKGSKLFYITQSQGWKCPVCGEHLFNGEELQMHHIFPVNQGGTDRTENLQLLHQGCHRQVHFKLTSLARAEGVSRMMG